MRLPYWAQFALMVFSIPATVALAVGLALFFTWVF